MALFASRSAPTATTGPGVAGHVRNDGEWPQRLGLEAIQRPLAGLTMQSQIGNLRKPLPQLPIYVVHIGELAQRTEVLAKITDSSFDLAFFPAARRIAGARGEAIFTCEAQKTREKTDKPAVVFGNGGGQIIVGNRARDATQGGECVDVAAGERLETLTVSELYVEHAAVRID